MTDSNQAVHGANLSCVRPKVALGVLLALVLALAGSAGAAPSGPVASASAFGVRVVEPGKAPASAGAISSPPQSAASVVSWAYGDGAVTTGEISGGTNATVDDDRAVGRALVTVRSVSLFGGEITASSVTAKSISRASSTTAGGDLSASGVSGLAVLGESVTAAPNAKVPLGDWGYAVVLEQAVNDQKTTRQRGHRGFVAGLHVHLTADHGGLAAGTEIFVGYAEAAATAPRTLPSPPAPPPSSPPNPPHHDPVPPPSAQTPTPPPVVQNPPPGVKPHLTEGGYVFPVYGPASFGDDFRAGRADTGWHHGNDIFAPLGAPVLAVTDGTLFLVGWNTIGGNRVWLRDLQGNEFYYAHLSAFSPLAKDGAHVQAGDVIGFVGATGDAVGTPTHLHFEIHPAQLLWMGYDGVIDPYPYLLAWRRLDDASFDVTGWRPPAGKAPPPPAVLLQADDISTSSGLDPEGLEGALAGEPLFGEGPPGPTIVYAAPGFGD
jgi:murein DD-endopeptidase MepM/ murein hydrolase activator NlpD